MAIKDHNGTWHKSLKEWNATGFLIKKGEKSVKRDTDGTPLFSEYQVLEKPEEEYDDEHEHQRDRDFDMGKW